jgi:hypothetical protein
MARTMAVTPRNRTKVVVAVIAILSALVGGVMLYVQRLTWEEHATVEFGEDALAEPFLVAQRFLARFDTEVRPRRTMRIPEELPPTDGVLLISGRRHVQSDRTVRGMLDWVEAGGRLIVVATDFWNDEEAHSNDPLLDRIGLRLVPAEKPEDIDASSEPFLDEPVPTDYRRWRMSVRGPNGGCGPDAAVMEVWLADTADAARALAPWRRQLDAVGERRWAGSAANRAGTQWVQLEHGAGMLTVLTSAEVWRNDFIRCHDHAHLLRYLAADGTTVTWVDRVSMPALPVLLWQQFPVAVLWLAAALAFWLWYAVVRPGPVRPLAPPTRRALLEHVDGVARFYWQQRASSALLAPLRRDVAARIGRRARRIGAHTDDVMEAAAAACELPANEVRRALAAEPPARYEDFARAVRALQQLRKQL